MSKDTTILYGKGTTEGIVTIEPVYGQENTVEVFRRIDGELQQPEYKRYKPFIYLPEKDSIYDEFYESTKVIDLFGTNHYNRLVEHNNYGFLKWIQKNADDCYLPFLQSQWMIKTGETLFTGMEFDDPLRLYLDIETYTKAGYEFSNSSRPEDQVIIISLRTNWDQEYLLYIDESDSRKEIDTGVVLTRTNEKKLLETFIKLIRKIDPDIIVTHGGFNFDLPYLRDRMQLHEIGFNIGRDGSEPHTFYTKIKFAEKEEQYENFNVYGRHVLDTYFFARQYDVVARDLEGYNLKYCVKYLGKADENRTYIEGDKIAWYWDNDKDKLLDYAMDDVRETQVLDQEWGLNTFAQTKMAPLPMQDVMRYGTGNKIDLMFCREYYLAKWSIGKPEEKRKFGGGYADTFIYGLIEEPTVYMDVDSLYPSLGQVLKIKSKKDELNLYPRFLNLLKEERFKYKNRYKNAEKGSEEYRKYKALDGSVKILLNTMSYGYLGSAWGNFNDYDEAERITKWGQKIIKRMIQEAETQGGKVCKVDTDGALVVVPQKFRGSIESETEYINLVQDNVNKWVETQL